VTKSRQIGWKVTRDDRLKHVNGTMPVILEEMLHVSN